MKTTTHIHKTSIDLPLDREMVAHLRENYVTSAVKRVIYMVNMACCYALALLTGFEKVALAFVFVIAITALSGLVFWGRAYRMNSLLKAHDKIMGGGE